MNRRFFIEDDRIKEGKAFLNEREAKHIGKVLRLGVGDTIYLLDEKGFEYKGVISVKHLKSVEVEIFKKMDPRKMPSIKVVLAQALPKAQKMDVIIQKSTELGVSTIIPFLSARSVPRLNDERSQKRRLRWQKIALESTKQCGRVEIPQIENIVPFDEIIGELCNNSLKIILWEDEKNSTLKELLRNNRPSKSIFCLVGPEGGFTINEVEMAKGAGFNSVNLGGNTLRTETAALCLLSILGYEWGNPD